MKTFKCPNCQRERDHKGKCGYNMKDTTKKQSKTAKEIIKNTPKLIAHIHSCGEPIKDKKGKFMINCGDSLSDDNFEFAQCFKCREKDLLGFEKQYNTIVGGVEKKK